MEIPTKARVAVDLRERDGKERITQSLLLSEGFATDPTLSPAPIIPRASSLLFIYFRTQTGQKKWKTGRVLRGRRAAAESTRGGVCDAPLVS